TFLPSISFWKFSRLSSGSPAPKAGFDVVAKPMKILAHTRLGFMRSPSLCEVEQLSVEIGSGAGHERIRVDRPGVAIDIGERAARFGDEKAARPRVDGRDPEDDVGGDAAGGQVG